MPISIGPALIALGLAAGHAAEPADLGRLVERHTAAVGGREAIEAIEAIEYRLLIAEPSGRVRAVYRADRRGRMRVDVFHDGERVYTEGYDGRHGWQMGGGAASAEQSSVAGEAALRHGIDTPGQLFGLHEVAGLGHHLELVGREVIDEISYHVIRMTYADGYAVDYYVHPDSYLIERKRERRALHPDLALDEVHIETRWSDCRPSPRVVRCFEETTTNLDTGEWMQTASIEGIVNNPALAPGIFVRPSAKPNR